MKTFRVLNKWDLPVPDKSEGWFADWAIRRTKHVSGHLARGTYVLRDLRDQGYSPERVVEYFGGLGVQSLVIQNLWPSAWPHHLYENNPDAVAYLEANIPVARIEHADSFNVPVPRGGLHVLDFGDLTISKANNPGKHRDLLDKVFGAEPSAVVLTDIAGDRFHLLKKNYAKVLGPLETYEDYLRRMGSWIQREYGYAPVLTAWRSWSSVTSFAPEDLDFMYPPHRVEHLEDFRTPALVVRTD